MSKLIDLTGKKFGRWHVLYKTNKRSNGQLLWNCKCDCGKEKNVNGVSLRRGVTKSCGCYRSDLFRIDLTNQRFGKQVAISVDLKDYQNNRCSRWICKCDCGNTHSVMSDSLLKGKSLSCGCLKKSISTFRDKKIYNKKFGRLTALYKTKITKCRNRMWMCKCDCGENKEVNSKYLLNGSNISCGCRRSDTLRMILQSHEHISKVRMGTQMYWRQREMNA